MEKLEREEITTHINEKIEEFRHTILQIAIDKNHPFINAILLNAKIKFRNQANSGIGTFLDDEDKFL